MSVLIETSEGTIVIDLYLSERPHSSRNFLKLCKMKYYNCCLFHSIQHNLVAQTGDPTGTGKGGKSVYGQLYGEQADFFEAEVKPRIKHTKLGTVSMVNNGKDMHGSQFFITLAPDLEYLNGKHTGTEYTIPDRSPIPTREELDSGRIGVFEAVDDTEGMTEEEIEEMFKQREAKANAQILEMVGDIPDAEIKPEDNVLFVCKLNAVTTSEDLEVIFSRFGKILSCEVIKEPKTNESLQYAFIEFSTAEECERAYFKMDNVLIDERRIHVDFSQSVAKLQQKGRWKGPQPVDKQSDEPQDYRPRERRRKSSGGYGMVFDDVQLRKSPDHERKEKRRDNRDDGRHHRRRSRSRSRDRDYRRRRRSRSRSRDRRRYRR